MNKKNQLFSIIICSLLVFGASMAVVDKNYRPAFFELVKIGFGTYIGWVSKDDNDDDNK